MIGEIVRRILGGSSQAQSERVTHAWRGIQITFDPRTDIGSTIVREGAFEEREIDIATALFVARHGAESRCIVDVGANIGIHSLHWAQALPGTPVFAIEPSPATHELLRQNIEANCRAGQVSAFQCAMSDQDGEVDFFLTEDDSYNSMKDTKRKRVERVIRVPAMKLDSLDSKLGGHRLGLLKIDVEGMESTVIAGARKVIARDRPILFVEIYGGVDSNPDPEGTIAQVRSLDYDAYVFGKDVGLARFTHHDDEHYNYFFIPRGD